MALNTLGIRVFYCCETTAGTTPVTGWVEIPDCKVIPAYGSEPTQLDSTPLSEDAFRRYVPGLRDTGGAIGLTFNDDDAFETVWASLMSAYATAKADGKRTWFEYVIPGKTNAFKFTGAPVELGFGGAEVDSVLENTGYIVPDYTDGWGTKYTA